MVNYDSYSKYHAEISLFHQFDIEILIRKSHQTHKHLPVFLRVDEQKERKNSYNDDVRSKELAVL